MNVKRELQVQRPRQGREAGVTGKLWRIVIEPGVQHGSEALLQWFFTLCFVPSGAKSTFAANPNCLLDYFDLHRIYKIILRALKRRSSDLPACFLMGYLSYPSCFEVITQCNRGVDCNRTECLKSTQRPTFGREVFLNLVALVNSFLCLEWDLTFYSVFRLFLIMN